MSQEERQITIIANHRNEKIQFQSNAETFADLKEEEEASGLFEGNTRTIVRETKNELSMDDAELPSGGITLIVVADKVKSGADEYDEMDYHELRQECIDRGFSTEKYNGEGVTKNVMRAHLRDDDQEQEEVSEEISQAEKEEKFEQMKEEIDEAAEEYRETVHEIIEKYADVLSFTAIPDYDDFIENVKRELGL